MALKLTCILILFYLLALALTPIVISHFDIGLWPKPTLGTYRSDEISFLETYYLMKQGQNFYQAFEIARTHFVDGGHVSNDTFTWRTPTIFYLWLILTNNGQQILTLFLFSCFVSLFSVYLLAKKILGNVLAFLSPIFLAFYFLDGLEYKTAFLFTEWWGLFFYLWGLTLYLYQFKWFAILFFLLATLTRELFLLPLLLNLVFFKRKKGDFFIFTLPAVGFGIFYLIHQFYVAQNLNSSSNIIFWSRLHPFSWITFQRMISFSMQAFVFGGAKTHYLFFLLGLVGMFSLFLQRKNFFKAVPISLLAFLITLPFVAVYGNDYWGIVFMPLILISIPFLSLNIKKL